MSILLSVKNLGVHFGSALDPVRAVDDVSFEVNRGETVVLVGESGSGKSVSALSVARLLPPTARIVSGSVELEGRELLDLPEREMRDIRGAEIGLVFQEPQASLNPVMTVGAQIGETLKRHKGLAGDALKNRIVELIDGVGIPDPQRRAREYPHQLSGGMKQRIMTAIALAGDPSLLIADEPTTALDVTIQAQVLDLIKAQQARREMGILFITHDLAVAYQIADRIVVMKDGGIVEAGERDGFYANPQADYSKQLFDALPSWEKRLDEGYSTAEPDTATILNVDDLKIHFPIKKGVFRRTVGHVKAVDGVALSLKEASTLAIVGESGSGKTTMGKGILQLLPLTQGRVQYGDIELTALSRSQMRPHRSDLQIVFQDPFSSMNPRMMVGEIIEEGMVAQNILADSKERDARVRELLHQVGLEANHAYRYPHEFSGGQRQRICIARALAVEPKVIVCDEPTSALDVSVQAQILRLLRELQDRLGVSYVFVTHNIGVVAYIAHTVAVMYEGKVVEHGGVEQVLKDPQDPYTKKLLAAVPKIGASRAA
ncbi:MAG: ABC transporter ATP-binding protein [Pseudomonadota bacterium]